MKMMQKSSLVKRLLVFNGIIIAVAVLMALLQFSFFSWNLPFSVVSLYVFFCISSVFIVTGIELLYTIMPNNAGYGFLVGMFVKMGLFMMIFYSKMLLLKNIYFADKIFILVPLFVFLFLETLVVTNLLMQKSDKQ
jgi:hypothetical protein